MMALELTEADRTDFAYALHRVLDDVQASQHLPDTVLDDLRALRGRLAQLDGARESPDTVPPPAAPHDPVNHPAHYMGFSHGAEVIDIVECLPYNRGAAVKYLARAGRKAIADEREDLRKAAWYVARELERLGERR